MSARLAVAAAAALVVFATAGQATASALDVTGDQLRALAQRAPTDPRALEDLREVDTVDGRAVDVRGALAGATGPQLDERLRALSAGSPATGGAVGSAAAARADARAITSQARFRPAALPRPLRGVLRWIARALEPVTKPVADAAAWLYKPIASAFEAVAELLPGGQRTLWMLLAGVVLAAAATVTSRSIARRSPGGAGERLGRGLASKQEDADTLERAAGDAEASGDLGRAIRLRFKAGLLRLDAASVIAFRPSLTSGQVARRVRSPIFDALARIFDEVVYGGRPADQADVEASRSGWSRVLAEVRSR